MSKVSAEPRADVEVGPRKPLTPRQRLELLLAFKGRCACGCNERINDRPWIADHRIQRWLNGDDAITAYQPLLVEHDKPKTAGDATVRAKVKRQMAMRLDQPSTRSAAWGNKRRPMERAPRIPAKRGRHD